MHDIFSSQRKYFAKTARTCGFKCRLYLVNNINFNVTSSYEICTISGFSSMAGGQLKNQLLRVLSSLLFQEIEDGETGTQLPSHCESSLFNHEYDYRANWAECPKYDWLMQLSDFRYPLTANCLITLSDFNPTQWLIKNKALNAPIKFEKIVMVIINTERGNNLRREP